MGRKAKRLRLLKKLAAKEAAANPSMGKENSVVIEEMKKAVEEAPAPVVEEIAEEVVEETPAPVIEEAPAEEPVVEAVEEVVEEKPKTTTRRKRAPRKKSKSSK